MLKTNKQPGTVNATLRKWIQRVLGPVVRVMHRPRVTGWERLPEQGPYMLVSNHSAGMGLSELASFLWLYTERHGDQRPMAGFALSLAFKVWPFNRILPAFGAVPSTYEAAFDTLEQGVPLLVFPGGDYDTLRPIWHANIVDFHGRKGFLKIAAQANIPIVPMAIQGSHFTAPILWRSRALAWLFVFPRLVGLKRWGLSLLGVLVAIALLCSPLPWYISLGLSWWFNGSPLTFFTMLPWPIRFVIGEPLTPQSLLPTQEDEDGVDLERALTVVEETIEMLLNTKGAP